MTRRDRHTPFSPEQQRRFAIRSGIGIMILDALLIAFQWTDGRPHRLAHVAGFFDGMIFGLVLAAQAFYSRSWTKWLMLIVPAFMIGQGIAGSFWPVFAPAHPWVGWASITIGTVTALGMDWSLWRASRREQTLATSR